MLEEKGWLFYKSSWKISLDTRE